MSPVFTASATAEFHRSGEQVFRVATNLSTLSEWVPYLQNVRLAEDTSPFGLGSVFLADEAFAEKLEERDHRFEVTAWTPGQLFGFKNLGDATLHGRLLIDGKPTSAQVTWNTSGGPTSRSERILATIMRSSVQKQTAQQTAAQLENLRRLVERAAARE